MLPKNGSVRQFLILKLRGGRLLNLNRFGHVFYLRNLYQLNEDRLKKTIH